MPRRSRRRRGDGGAVAVEFALVSAVLFPVLFGAVEYGLYFADAIAVQRSTGQVARSAGLLPATGPEGASACSGLALGSLGEGPLAETACSAVRDVDTVLGSVHVRTLVIGPDGAPAATPTWGPPNRVRVCVVNDHGGILPMIPLPGDGQIQARVDMPIEPQSSSGLLEVLDVGDLTSPEAVARDWDWCGS